MKTFFLFLSFTFLSTAAFSAESINDFMPTHELTIYSLINGEEEVLKDCDWNSYYACTNRKPCDNACVKACSDRYLDRPCGTRQE